MSEKITRETAFKTSYLNGKNVLFRVAPSHSIELLTDRIHTGGVVRVCEKTSEALVCFSFGHQSFTNQVSFDDILAVADKANGKQVTIDRFSGPYVDLRT